MFAKNIQKIIGKQHNNLKLTDFKIQNVVGHAAVDFEISLEGLYNSKAG